jgi:hypothetical protein
VPTSVLRWAPLWYGIVLGAGARCEVTRLRRPQPFASLPSPERRRATAAAAVRRLANGASCRARSLRSRHTAEPDYAITSSAVANSASGMVRPSARAVFGLMKSNSHLAAWRAPGLLRSGP